MNTNITEILAENERLTRAHRAEMIATAEAYGLPYPAEEAPSPTFQVARRHAESHSGSRLSKYFAAAQVAMPQPPSNACPVRVLIVTEARMLALPEPLLAQVQQCEKAYALGRWYVVTPSALWQSLTRLLGG